jgi:hypothetical protein
MTWQELLNDLDALRADIRHTKKVKNSYAYDFDYSGQVDLDNPQLIAFWQRFTQTLSLREVVKLYRSLAKEGEKQNVSNTVE